jgi:hypothetical protein
MLLLAIGGAVSGVHGVGSTMVVLAASPRTKLRRPLAVVSPQVVACRNRRERHLAYRGAVPETRMMAELMLILRSAASRVSTRRVRTS